ncbi:hypothetical protein HJC23_010685 [Cyclotella cryptica]|uniref:Uncharacterized protein n=1 Tax=Cyclotella cryptica TaxID=29204 RepID=A0ABD3PBJ3_9STRA
MSSRGSPDSLPSPPPPPSLAASLRARYGSLLSATTSPPATAPDLAAATTTTPFLPGEDGGHDGEFSFGGSSLGFVSFSPGGGFFPRAASASRVAGAPLHSPGVETSEIIEFEAVDPTLAHPTPLRSNRQGISAGMRARSSAGEDSSLISGVTMVSGGTSGTDTALFRAVTGLAARFASPAVGIGGERGEAGRALP